MLHIIKIIPHCINRNVVCFIVFNNIFKSAQCFISPSALMPTKRPKWWDMNAANKLMIFLQSFLWIFVANKNYEMNVASQWIVNQTVILFQYFNKHSMSIFEICQMSISIRLSRQIKRLVAIWTWTSAWISHINLPGFISVPNGPKTRSNFELMLESLP